MLVEDGVTTVVSVGPAYPSLRQDLVKRFFILLLSAILFRVSYRKNCKLLANLSLVFNTIASFIPLPTVRGHGQKDITPLRSLKYKENHTA